MLAPTVLPADTIINAPKTNPADQKSQIIEKRGLALL
jgi:hypothetical protein